MSDADLSDRIASVRRFNRFYTHRIGVLEEGLLRSPFSLTEARVLYELGNRERATASVLCETLGLDAGYLSRILRRLQKKGLLIRRPSATDRRQSLLSLTEEGRAIQAGLPR
jgi:DNA-binding MarR family transcriptional regulator